MVKPDEGSIKPAVNYFNSRKWETDRVGSGQLSIETIILKRQPVRICHVFLTIL